MKLGLLHAFYKSLWSVVKGMNKQTKSNRNSNSIRNVLRISGMFTPIQGNYPGTK